MSKKTKKHKERNKKNLIILSIIFMILIVSCTGYIIYDKISQNRNQAMYDEIDTNIEVPQDIENNKIITENMKKVISLKRQNEDVKGWIQIDDTMINYPILQTTDNDYYLNYTYKKEKSKYGSIYAKNECDILDNNSNVIIYGHNMRNGQMFNALLDYTDESFYKEHKTIKIATENEQSNYSIVAVFKSRIFYQNEENVFRYYNYTKFNNEESYNDFLENCRKIQLYDTGVSAEYGEQLITLITCEYSQKNGRIVIVAKKTQE